MNLVLEFDDLHWKEPENCLPSIRKLVEEVPNIKLSFFTVAKHSHIPIEANPTWCSAIHSYIDSDNVRLAVHGLDHSQLEFKITDKTLIITKLQIAEFLFQRAKLPFTKVFKGPHWGITQEVYDCLAEQGYKAVFSHPDYYNIKRIDLATIFYNWNLKDDAPLGIDTIISHGHTHNVCENGIAESVDKIIRFVRNNDVTFKFVDEV